MFSPQCVLSAEKSADARRNRHKRRIIMTKPPSPGNDTIQPINASKRAPTNHENEKPDLLIEGELGTIKADGKTIRANVEKFKNGSVTIRIYQGRISINDDLVTVLKPTNSKVKWSTNVVINSSFVASFKLQIFKRGEIKYIDNRGKTSYASF
ncbi:hypothetical protein U1Q18_049619 [Sarracenia purpurea var. burkii]